MGIGALSRFSRSKASLWSQIAAKSWIVRACRVGLVSYCALKYDVASATFICLVSLYIAVIRSSSSMMKR